MDIRTKTWNQTLLDAVAPNLAEKLGEIVPSYEILGCISSYFSDRWAFNPDCKVVAFTGDNPASLIGLKRILFDNKTGRYLRIVCLTGLGLTEGWLAVSLGTSDTLMLWLEEPQVVLDGHILCNPLNVDSYMAMLG